ncbi:MAG: class I SAM-dependent methyltransferase [Bacteroidetes bacterium]|nr:class I SAM-dependent methyltransferase [Bacteroidota bacterium]
MEKFAFFFDSNKKYDVNPSDCLELSCGYGKLYANTHNQFNKYVGVDFSKLKIGLFRKNFPGVELICDNVVDYRPKQKLDIIHSNQLVQYLTKNQIKELIRWNIKFCSKGGIIIHRNIPDTKLLSLYFSGYLKPNLNTNKVTRVYYPLLYRFYSAIKSMIGSFSTFGFWYTADEILSICNELGVEGEIYGSILYRYRFNLVIRL